LAVAPEPLAVAPEPLAAAPEPLAVTPTPLPVDSETHIAKSPKPAPVASGSREPAGKPRSLRQATAVRPGGLPVETLRLRVGQSGLLRFKTDIVQYQVEDSRICSAVRFDSRELTLIGKAVGATSLLARAEGDQVAGRYRIEVSQATANTVDDETMERLRRSIRELFPRSQVSVRGEGGRLVVSGQVRSDEEAHQILALVRRIRLVPVVDRLQVR
jgi:Flp pilus assembly secretin CpaC